MATSAQSTLVAPPQGTSWAWRSVRGTPAISVRKRLIDLVFASLLLTAAAPIVLLIAVAIKLTSPGPVFFRQRRLGLGGRAFTILKFRTMAHGASDAPHRDYVRSLVTETCECATPGLVYKLTADARVTWVGHLLRRSSLDELPQLWNVARGEMSLVGPRPPVPYEVELYQPWQLERLSVRPGITGLWQVSGRNRLSYVEMCQLDVKYVHNWSISEDFRIMLKTPWVMLTNSGSAA
ncbi:MAG: sugar transferase [Gemmatimonadaceae bacterium]